MAPLKTIKFGMTSSRVHYCDLLINHLTTEPELFEFTNSVFSDFFLTCRRFRALLQCSTSSLHTKENRFSVHLRAKYCAMWINLMSPQTTLVAFVAVSLVQAVVFMVAPEVPAR